MKNKLYGLFHDKDLVKNPNSFKRNQSFYRFILNFSTLKWNLCEIYAYKKKIEENVLKEETMPKGELYIGIDWILYDYNHHNL